MKMGGEGAIRAVLKISAILLRCRIHIMFLSPLVLSKREKLYKLRPLSLSLFVSYWKKVCLPFNF